VLTLLALLPGCDGPTRPIRFAPHQRLIEVVATTSEGSPEAPRVLPRETRTRFERIGSEARPVLRGFPTEGLRRRIAASSPAQPQTLLASFPLPDEFANRTRVVLTLSALRDESWTALTPPTLQEVATGPEGPVIEAPFSRRLLPTTPGQEPSDQVWLRGFARQVLEGTYRRIDCEPTAIPAGAQLEVGFGVLDTARDQGPVEFTLSACRGETCARLLSETVDPAQPEAATWRDRRIPLDSLARQEVAFRFEAWHRTAASDAFTLPVWSDPTLLAPSTARTPPTNLVLVSLDTLRADRLPSYGYPRNTAPFLEERLAREGTLFEHAFSAASTTGPSHMTVFTSLTPSAHGLRDNILRAQLPAEIPTLAERLREAGFATGAVTEDGALAFGSGIERGFESYREFHTTAEPPPNAETTFAAARAWLDRNRDRRFLLFVQTYETHTPYRAPEDTPALDGPLPTLAGGPADLRVPKIWRPEGYDREIRYTDQALQHFVEGLEDAGLLENTLIVVFSDHGEAFLEHGYMHHGGAIHDEVLHVPLLFHGPGIAAGQRVSAPVGLVDLLPTLLELLELPAPPAVMGRSFASLVRGAAPDPSWWERPLFSESWAKRRLDLRDGGLRVVDLETPSLAVRKGSRKLIRERVPNGARYTYFDLADDPGEQRDLYASQPGAAADLQALLDAYARDAEAQPVAGEKEVDSARLEALRALGYID
jgi:arylsulfatase A-like enzyme